MSKNPSAPQFESAMRGYDRNSVSTAVAALVEQRAAAQQRAEKLERELAALRLATSKDGRGKAYLAMCRTIETMLLASAEDADAADNLAATAIKQELETTAAEIESVRVRDTQHLEALVAKAKIDGDNMIVEARAEARAILADATQKMEAKKVTAAEAIEVARAEGVRMALEFENALTTEREAFDADALARYQAADADLAAAEAEMEHTKAETAALPENMRRAAQALIDASSAGAVEIIAQARTRADFFRQEIERELVALTARRDANNAALSSTGGSLTGLSGSAAITANSQFEDEAGDEAVAETAEEAPAEQVGEAAPAEGAPVPAPAAGTPTFPQPSRGRAGRKAGAPVPQTDSAPA